MLRRLLFLPACVALGCGGSTDASIFDPASSPDDDTGTAATDTGGGGDDTGGTTASDSTVPTDDTGVAPIDSGVIDSGVESDTSVVEPADTAPPPMDTDVPPPTDTKPTVECTEPGAQIYEGHCYIALNYRTWTAARDFCQMTLKGHLATINSDGEQKFLNSFGGAMFAGGERWIGLSRATGTPYAVASYKWVTGETSTYANWQPGEPNYSGNCVRLRSDNTWADQNCTNSLLGICERE